MITKDKILDEIKRTAKENGGVPLGRERFERETGIKPYDLGKYWAKFGDAQREAGFSPNTLNLAYGEEFLLEKFIAFMRELGRYPTRGDLLVKSTSDADFPSPGTMAKFGSKKETAEKIAKYAGEKEYADIVELCRPIIEASVESESSDDHNSTQGLGEVYLFKSGRYYKIGKTNDTVRRGNELRVQLAEVPNLIHSIRTDDPSGVEAYWHKRFETKRMNGEWFDLNAIDIRAFKRWRKIV
jgi:hypothetical protein